MDLDMSVGFGKRVYRNAAAPEPGATFGHLSVVGEGPRHPVTDHRQVTCACTCGAVATVSLYSLRRGQTKSCGCLSPRKKARPDPLIGEQFGRWRIVGAGQLRVGKSRTMRCQCECGTVRDVRIVGLRSGKSKGCGCHERSWARDARLRDEAIDIGDLPPSTEEFVSDLPVAKIAPTVAELKARITDLEARLQRAADAEALANRRVEILEEMLQLGNRQRWR